MTLESTILMKVNKNVHRLIKKKNTKSIKCCKILKYLYVKILRDY